MHVLRNAHFLARLVLVWFALSVSAAIASPLIKPLDLQLVCTGSGLMKVLVEGDDGSTKEVASHTLDCPLCLVTGAPPAVILLTAEPAQPLAEVLHAIAVTHTVWRTAAPLPARGPPAFS